MDDDVVVSYGALDARSRALADDLHGHGLRPGDHIALLMENQPAFLEVCWAAQRSGLYYTPINWHLGPSEIEYILKDCGAKVLVADSANAERVRTLDTAGVRVISTGRLDDGWSSYQSIVEQEPTSHGAVETEGSDMIYTSGTSGRPKGGVRALSGMTPSDANPSLLRFFVERYGIGHDTVYLVPGAPLYHAAQLRFTMAVHRAGGTCVLMRSFEPHLALRAIDRFGVTHSQWVPTMFVRLLELPDTERNKVNLGSHRVAIHAGAPCTVALKRSMLEWWGPIIHEYYGASEGGVVTHIGPEEWLAHPGSVGRPAFGRLHILDDEGTEVAAGTVGRIFSEGGVPIAYLNDEEKTASAHSAAGWGTVGDLGYLDEDGYLYLSDRRDDLILRGGVNIYPSEVEEVLRAHGQVSDAAVIGVPDAVYGQQVAAVIEPVDSSVAGPDLADELYDHCRASLARFKCPTSIRFEPQIPRSSVGKIQRRLLAAQHEAMNTYKTGAAGRTEAHEEVGR